MTAKALVSLILFLSIGIASAEVRKIEYEGFTVWIDCARRGPVLFHYIAEADSGSLPRYSNYIIDPNVPRRCQSISTETFGEPYDVGHQVPANHFDGSGVAIRQTNFWTNLLPQTSSMNRGAWLRTEYIIDCIRDEVPLEVWGGPIWGDNTEDDDFVESHGMATPDYFWKVVIRTDDREAIAWIMPNGDAPSSSLDRWIVSVAEVERATGRRIRNVADKNSKPDRSWPRPSGCSVQ